MEISYLIGWCISLIRVSRFLHLISFFFFFLHNIYWSIAQSTALALRFINYAAVYFYNIIRSVLFSSYQSRDNHIFYIRSQP